MATRWKDVAKKLREMGIVGGYDWQNLMPKDHLIALKRLERVFRKHTNACNPKKKKGR